jgi:integrase
MHTLTEEEVGRLFQASRNHRLHVLWVLLATTGLRLGEALGLLWSDIDFTGRRLIVNRALQRQPGIGYVFIEPKTARSRRTVYLAAGTLTALTEHRRRQTEMPALGSANSIDSPRPSVTLDLVRRTTRYSFPASAICLDLL